MTLTSELYLDTVKPNQRAKYLGHRSFSAKVIVTTGWQTSTATYCSAWTSNSVINSGKAFFSTHNMNPYDTKSAAIKYNHLAPLIFEQCRCLVLLTA